MAYSEELLVPNQLEAGAVVPQCLDNMYVSNELFRDMTSRGVGLHDPQVAGKRDVEAKTEYMRSLVYASQVVINRAFFINNPIVYSAFEDTHGNEANRRAFIALLRQRPQAIVPYLWKEGSFKEWPEFDLSQRGQNAVKSLMQEIGAIKSVRLSKDDSTNQLLTSNMGVEFGRYFGGLRQLETGIQVNTIASELFGRALTNEEFKAFWSELVSMANFVNSQPAGEPVTRQLLYKEFICQRNTNVADGVFRHPGTDRFVLEKKKLADLRYNTNLADYLHRYSFAPIGLPGRSALCDETSGEVLSSESEQLLDEVSKNIKDTFFEGTQKALYLPLLRDLDIKDVYRIRTEIPEWAEFIKAQEAILQDPLHCMDMLSGFGSSFERFQMALSDWYYKETGGKASEGQYAAIIRIGFSIAGKLLAIGFGKGVYEKMLIASAGELVPQRFNRFVARIMVDIYDVNRHKPDRDRSYSFDLMKYESDNVEERVRELLARVREQTGNRQPEIPPNSDAANAGKKA